MTRDLLLRRKLTLRAEGQQVVFVKKRNERLAHVLMKAFVWALYLPTYPDLAVEVGIGDRYKPDVVATDAFARPVFWGEAGSVGAGKLESLLRRYRDTHFAIAKWATRLDPFVDLIRDATDDVERRAPIDLLRFPDDSAERFIDARGRIDVSHDDLTWTRLD